MYWFNVSKIYFKGCLILVVSLCTESISKYRLHLESCPSKCIYFWNGVITSSLYCLVSLDLIITVDFVLEKLFITYYLFDDHFVFKVTYYKSYSYNSW